MNKIKLMNPWFSNKEELLFFLATIFFISCLVFMSNFHISGPMIQGDEGSYLANASALVGFRNDLAGSYHSGYSIFLAPAFLFGYDPNSIWMCVKLINTFLFSILLICLWGISKKLLPEISFLKRLISLALVSLYPINVVYVGFSFSQLALASIYTLNLLLIFYAIDAGIFFWFILGILASYLYWIHPTGFAPLLATIITLFYISHKKEKLFLFLVFLFTTIVTLLSYHFLFTPFLHEKMHISKYGIDASYPSLRDMIMPFSSLHGISDIVTRFSGQIFYFTAGTMGLIWLGYFAAFKKISNLNRIQKKTLQIDPNHIFFIYSGLSFIGIILLSVLMLSSLEETLRLDQWMYGRYADSVVMPILFFALLQRSFRPLLISIPIVVISFLIFKFGVGFFNQTSFFNIPSMWQAIVLKNYSMWTWMLSSLLIIIFLSFAKRNIGMLLICFLFLFSSSLQILWHQRVSKIAIDRSSLAHFIRDNFSRDSCLGWDHSGENSTPQRIFFFDLTFALYDYRLARTNVNDWKKDCNGPLITFRSRTEAEKNNAFSIVRSLQNGPYLWVKKAPPYNFFYPATVDKDKLKIANFLEKGWYDFEEKHIWSKEKAILNLPVPSECELNNCSFKFTLSAFAASAEHQVNIKVYDFYQKHLLSNLKINKPGFFDVLVPVRKNTKTMLYEFVIEDATSPKLFFGSEDSRILGVSLSQVNIVFTKNIIMNVQ